MRFKDWRTRYHNVIDDIRAKPFAWGPNDCFSGLIIPVVDAITGDVASLIKYVGKYKTEAGALRLMKRSGFENLGDYLASEFPEIHPANARIGDLVAIPTDDGFGHALGVVNGDRVFVMLERSLGTRSLAEASRAYRVD